MLVANTPPNHAVYMGINAKLLPCKRIASGVIFLCTMLLLGGMASNGVRAQDEATDENEAIKAAANVYAEEPVDQNQKKNMAAIGAILRAGKFENAGQQNDLDTYFKTYALARWTQASALGKPLADYRKDLFNNIRQAKSGQVHDRLNDLVMEYMNNLAKSDKYHPAVRYNAMLTIGDLNSVEGSQPVPLEGAMPILLAAVNDPKQIDPVKIAALIGINRHVSAGLNNAPIQGQVLSAMLKLAAPADSSDSRDPGRESMRMQAIEILGLLGNVGANNQVVQFLSGVAGDTKSPFSLRTTAAEALGKLKYAGAAGLNPTELAKPLAQLMSDACGAELSVQL